MECNKDEANRAKELAEKKFFAKDIVGAKKFALKAQNLFPGLEGIPQMIATLNVHISAENKINGESDWYGILGVNPRADDEAVKKQYRKLALMLHPDKNKSVGADEAFKLISEAWSLLSDKARRSAYDQKRNGKAIHKVSTPSGGSTASKAANGFYNVAKTTTSSVKTSKSNSRAGQSSNPAVRSSKPAGQSSNPAVRSSKPAGQSSNPAGRSSKPAGHSSNPSSSHKAKLNTFWTVCHRCKMQYEYLRVYLNHNLLCPNCHEPFLALETAPPTTSNRTPWKFSQQQQNSTSQPAQKSTSSSGRNHASSSGAAGFGSHDSYGHSNFQWAPFSRTGGTGASSAAQAASVVQQAYEKVRREREEAQAATKREEAMRRKHHATKRASGASSTAYASAKKRRSTEDGASTHGTNITNKMGVVNGGTTNLSGSKLGSLDAGWISGNIKHNKSRNIPQIDIQNLLIEKAKREIQKKLHELNSLSAADTAPKGILGNVNANEKQNKSLIDNEAQDQSKSAGFVDKINGDHCIKSFSSTCKVDIDAQTLEAMSINVPDPDFHDFDKDRTERSFGDNEVWAAYDDDDGMPRYYAMIHNVISLDPFKMQISWLNSKTNSELGPLNWVGSGFSKTSGEFRIGKHEINGSLNSFSHKVKWTKGIRGSICLYPRKGDVWAIYRNWSPDWNELTADEVIHKYDMVEVLDYSEELGVTVLPLVKVAGFKTVFHRHLDHREIRRIPREEMFCFSHQVPSHLLTGQESSNAPKGCWELDPAATPVELLQVIKDVEEEEILEKDKEVNEANVADVEKANDEGVVENCKKASEEQDSGAKVLEEIDSVANVGKPQDDDRMMED
ncbi:hypothetical protein CCACVL1_24085 [Corchorus capsularis]|uniref:J domain-containing protein n=1 Tax=Corchorus capsularis TaxID=210143 RepID=A0A1R3GR17_COCAP|nr:hypothetical protein CCACVL1_24085 [Corchorus capsularis]